MLRRWIQNLKGLRAFWRVVRDPRRLDEVFVLADADNTQAMLETVRASILRQPDGVQVLGRRDRLELTIEEALAFSRKALQTTIKDRTQTPQRWGGDGGWVLASAAGEKGPDLAEVVSAIARRPWHPPPSGEPSGFTLAHAGWTSAGVTAAGGLLFGVAWLHLQSLHASSSMEELHASARRGRTLEAVGLVMAAGGTVGMAAVGVLALLPRQPVPVVVAPTANGMMVGAGFRW